MSKELAELLGTDSDPQVEKTESSKTSLGDTPTRKPEEMPINEFINESRRVNSFLPMRVDSWEQLWETW